MRFYNILHPKPWAKSPEEAAWALMQRIMGSWPMGWLMESKKGEQYNVSLLPLAMARWCRGYWSSQGRVGLAPDSWRGVGLGSGYLVPLSGTLINGPMVSRVLVIPGKGRERVELGGRV